MRTKLVLILLGLGLGLLCLYLFSSRLSDGVVTLGKHKFMIPEMNASLDSTIPWWLQVLPGLDDGSRDFLLFFPVEEIVQHIPAYRTRDGNYKEDIIAILSVLTDEEIRRHQDPNFGLWGEAWHGTGGFDHRLTERSEDGYYKIYQEIGYPNRWKRWALLTQNPTLGNPLPKRPEDFWVAYCSISNAPATSTGKHTHCSMYEFFDDIAIDFRLSEQNLHLISEVKKFLREKVLEWKVVDKG